ncbi:MAG: hypothetical protein K0S65_1121, partial [Labilithrix sp.]|nr:hypothetical protein [Labilithrix sp.]
MVLSSSVARAEERTGAQVEVDIVGGSDPALEASIAELLASDGLGTRFTGVERDRRRDVSSRTAAGEILALVEIDLRRHGMLELRIVDPRRRRMVVRDLPIPHGIDEIVREEASHIVAYTVEAISRGEQVGEPQPPANEERGAHGRAVSAAPRRAMALELETIGAVRTFASIAPAVLGSGAALALSVPAHNVRLGGAL